MSTDKPIFYPAGFNVSKRKFERKKLMVQDDIEHLSGNTTNASIINSNSSPGNSSTYSPIEEQGNNSNSNSPMKIELQSKFDQDIITETKSNFYPAGLNISKKKFERKKLTMPSKTNSGCSPENSTNNSINNSNSNQGNNSIEEHANSSSSESLLKIDSHCKCDRCFHWTKGTGWGYESNEMVPQIRLSEHARPLPFLKNDTIKNGKIIVYKSYNELSKVECQLSGRILVHGEIIPTPVKSVSETHFHLDVLNVLKQHKYETTKAIQSYAWPIILKNLHLCVIGERNSGKTMAYLPAIASLALYKENYKDLNKYKQPVIIILCNTSEHCEKIYHLISKFFATIHRKPKITLHTYPINNIHRTNILITLPQILLESMESHMINLKSLCHLVLENVDVMLKKSQQILTAIFNVIDEMLAHRSCMNQVQLIMTGERWHNKLENLLNQLYYIPTVCIDNYLEAAVYGKINFNVKLINSTDKMEYLSEILTDEYRVYKCVVIVDDDQMQNIVDFLKSKNLQILFIKDEFSEEDIMKIEIKWKKELYGNYSILLCSDSILNNLLTITNAHWLIHYNFPQTWTGFIKRFACLLDNYQSPFNEKKNDYLTQSYLIIDEANEKQIPRLLQLFQRFNNNIVTYFENYSKNMKKQKELQKINDFISLCDRLKLFGQCYKDVCLNRHFINQKLDIIDGMPRYGTIKFQIIEMLDVSRFIVKLLEHQIDNRLVHKYDDNTDYLVKLEMLENLIPVEELKIDCLYIYVYTDNQMRILNKCLVIENNKNLIRIKLLNNGNIIRTDKSKLYELPHQLKLGLPIIEIYLANYKPVYDDENFSSRSFTKVRHLTDENTTYTSEISLQLGHTLWVDSFYESVVVNQKNFIKFDLMKELKKMKIIDNSKQIVYLTENCAKNGVKLPVYEKIGKTPIVKQFKQPEPQWAFLDEHDICKVVLTSISTPEKFYIRLDKYNDLLQKLHEEINQLTKNPNFDKSVDVYVNKCYIAPDPVENERTYIRVLIRNIENDKALCHFVDYGDEIWIDLKDLRYLPDHLITKLPFQAIQCRLHGITSINETYSTDVMDVIYKYEYIPDTDFWRPLYVKMITKQLIRENYQYSILLKDGFHDSHILINRLLLDCGMVKMNDTDGNLGDFILELDDDNDEENDEQQSIISDFSDENFKDMELFVTDEKAFLQMFSSSVNNLLATQAEYLPTTRINELPALTYIEPSKHLTPSLIWSQSSKLLKFKMSLVNITDYSVHISRGVRFIFRADVSDQIYKLHLPLYRNVSIVEHSIIGPELRVILKKSVEQMWPRLTSIKCSIKSIHYAFSKEELEDEPQRKFLDLGIKDDNSKIDEQSMIMVTEFSDMESDFGEEFNESD